MLWQWVLLVGASLALFWVAPWSRTAKEFFRAAHDGREPGFWLLTSSLVISWIFAKSITNAANLGLSFGIVGGVAYAAYYLSFLVAGVVLYRMRTRGGFESIHAFLRGKFGRGAVVVFSLLIGIRLFNEVWSNTMVIGSYFGAEGSPGYYTAILVFTGLTLAYALKGGLRSSLLTDLIQMVLFGVLLFIILGILLPRSGGRVEAFLTEGSWSLAGGVNLLLVALIQVFSYPFHDPVLTDRAFIAPPRTTLRSYLWAALIGGLCILLFSFVGIYARMQGLSGQVPVVVAQTLGAGMMLCMNFIMVTSAASTLDSALASFSKLSIVDLRPPHTPNLQMGRRAMAALTLLGTLPIFLGPEILDATTISGTMVLGLAPVFLFWRRPAGPWSFHLAVGCGIAFGIWLTSGLWPERWVFFPGKYGDLLSVNLTATLGCFALYLGATRRCRLQTHTLRRKIVKL